MQLRWRFVLALSLAACDSTVPIDTDAGVDAGIGDTDAGADCTGRPADAPSTRGETNGVYDAARGRIVVYGGNAAAPVDCMPMYDIIGELWAFHLDCASWEQLISTGGPGNRARHATALDTERNRMLVFGGRDRPAATYVNYADVWALDLATDTWSPIETTGTGPSPRSSAVAVYDAARDRLIVYGGNTSTSGLTLTGVGDVFALDLATGVWSEITAAGAPSPRLFASGVVVGQELVVFGGTPDFDGPFLNDTHALDLTTDTWRMIEDGSTAPESRFGAEIFAGSGSIVMFAGHDGAAMGNRNDVWALDLGSATWSPLRPGDVLGGSPAGFCDFPADFTTPEAGAPERRYAFLHVQDSANAYVFGGKTDCGNVNDVWRLALGDGAWTQLRPATGGEACNRTGRTGCTTLCF